jgi:hypothetical protein
MQHPQVIVSDSVPRSEDPKPNDDGAPSRSSKPAPAQDSKLRTLWRTLAEATLLRTLREDRLLLAATLVLSASALAPMWRTPILPLVDMGANIGAAGLLDDAAFGDGVVARHYFVNLRLVPYWTVYLLISLFEQLAGPFVAVKVVVGLSVILLPLAVMRLLIAMNRSPRLGLWAFILSWDTNQYWGWISFQIGMAMALYAIAKLIEMKSYRDALKVMGLSALIAVTHVHAVVLLLGTGGLLALRARPFFQSLRFYAIGIAGSSVLIIGWLFDKVLSKGGTVASFGFDSPPIQARIDKLFEYTLDNIPGDAQWISRFAFTVLLCAPALALLNRRSPPSVEARFAPLCLLLASGALYLSLPFSIHGPISHWWTYPRFGTYMLIGLLALPRPRLERLQSLALMPGVVAAFQLHRATDEQFDQYGDYVTSYLRIVEHLPRNSRFMPLDLDNYRFRGTRRGALGQLHGYAASVTSSYDPHLFDEPNNPLRYRKRLKLPHQNWWRQHEFTMQDHGRFYDYIIVHPKNRDPFYHNGRGDEQVELLVESGPWRLYAVRDPVL